jgi:acetylornithine aminotransferase
VYQHAGIEPDVVPLAKGLASGVPVGACVVGRRGKGVFKPGNHGSTFGGNPLAMCGVITTLDTMKEEDLLTNAVRVGNAIRDGLAAALKGVAGVTEVRGMGMMIGVELDRPCGEIVKTALARGLIVNVTADNVIRLLPPLVMNADEGRQVVERLAPIVREFLEQPAATRAAAAR